MHAETESPESLALSLLARLANMLARPSRLVDPGHYRMLGGARLRQLSQHSAFRANIDDAIAKSLNLHGLELSEELPQQLATRPEARAAALLATAEPKDLEEAAKLLSAAILHKRLVRLIRKEDRAGAVEQLGRSAFQVAVREAFVLYAELGDLAPPEHGADAGDALSVGETIPILQRPGYDCLHAFVRSAEASLQPLIALRLPENFSPAIADSAINPRRQTQILSLFRRKMPGWDRWIG